MEEVIKINKEFFELTKSKQRSAIRLFIWFIVKHYLKTFKNK